jgi:hypothetical protein
MISGRFLPGVTKGKFPRTYKCLAIDVDQNTFVYVFPHRGLLIRGRNSEGPYASWQRFLLSWCAFVSSGSFQTRSHFSAYITQ